MIFPYHECPSFLHCSCNACPLDPYKAEKKRFPEEDKCRAHKPTRNRIGRKYPELLPYQGLTSREWKGKKRWESLSPMEQDRRREKMLEAYAKSKKLRQTGKLKNNLTPKMTGEPK